MEKEQIEKHTKEVLKNLKKEGSRFVGKKTQYNVKVEKSMSRGYWIDIFTDSSFFYKREIEYLTKNLDFSFVCVKVENDKPVMVFIYYKR